MKNRRKILAIVLFILPCLFFALAYLLMSMSGEDVAQSNMSSEKSFPALISWIYSYIPRIGEFITWPVARVLSYQTSFGLDLLIRVIDVAAVIGTVYAITFLSLRRKLSLRLLDAAVFDVIFLLMILVPQFVSPLFGNPFLSGFSFIHNYVTMSLIALLFVTPFIAPILGIKSDFKFLKNSCVMFVLGFLFAISSELLPFSFIAVVAFNFLYIKFVLHKKIKIMKWQVCAVIGIAVGLAFFYLGGGLSARTGFTYAETYDYVSLSMLLTSPRHFVVVFLIHFVKNVEYLIPILSFIVLATITYKVKKTRANTKVVELFALFGVFLIIYIIGASLILLDDAIAARFLLPCYLIFILTIGLFVSDYYSVLIDSVRKSFVAVVFLLLFSVIVIVDMLVGKIQYALRTNEQLASVRAKIEEGADEDICLSKGWVASEAGAVYSPIFSFTQEPIFEPWNVKSIYGHEIVWAEIGDEELCE